MNAIVGLTRDAALTAAQSIAQNVTAPIGAVTSNLGQRFAIDTAVGAADAIANAIRTTTSELQSLYFPNEILSFQYKFDIALADYSRAGLFEIGKLNIFRHITLPLPLNLVDTHQVQYEEGKPLIQTPENSVLDAGKAMAGFTTNELMVVLLKGPTFKQFELTWKLAPRNARESESLTEIIRVLNQAMAPSMAFAGAIFKFPTIFQLSFVPNHQRLYRFKPAVLKSFTTNFAAGGSPAFYKKTDAPESVEIKMTFLELEYWLSSDFNDTSNPYAGRAQTGGATRSLAGAAEAQLRDLLTRPAPVVSNPLPAVDINGNPTGQ